MTARLDGRRRLPLSAAVAVLALQLAAAPARSQQITSVTGIDGLPQAVIGTTLHIQGSDFGQHKPKVTLTDPATGKAYKLKVIHHGTGYVDARVKKAVVGDLQLALLPHGADEPALADAPVTILAPTLVVLEGAPAVGQLWPSHAGELIWAHGANFGCGKLKAHVAGKPAKLFYPGPDTVHVRIPKKMPAGEHLLELSNGAGSCSVPVWVQPGPKEPDTLDPAQASLQLVIEGVAIPMQVTKAQLGSTVSPVSGEARPFLILAATEPASQLKLSLLVRLGDGAQAPAVLAAPFVPQAGEADVAFGVYTNAPGDVPWAPGDSSPPPSMSWQPVEPFSLALAQLDPQQHSAQVEFGGSLVSAWGPWPLITLSGVVSIAP